MRICHVIESCGGSGQVVLDLVTANIEAGDDVTLIYSPLRAEPHFVDALGKLKNRGKFLALPMKRQVGLHDAVDLWKLYRLLKTHGPFDIIHSHSSKAGALARMAGLSIPHAKQVYTPHAFMTMAPGASPVYGWIEWLFGGLTDAFICVSAQEYRHAHEQLKLPRSKLHIIPNGVHLDYPADRAYARGRLGFDEADYIVGFVGRLAEQKNPGRLVNAFAIAAAQKPNLRLAVVGDGPLRMETEQALASRGLGTRARLLGECNGRDLMPGFDCLLCSSDYESFGLVILEALAAGTPVVTTPVGIAEEAITPGKTGFVTADFNAESLASALLKLATLDNTARLNMAAEAKTQAQRFSIKQMADKTRKLYTDIMAQKTA